MWNQHCGAVSIGPMNADQKVLLHSSIAVLLGLLGWNAFIPMVKMSYCTLMKMNGHLRCKCGHNVK